MLLKIWQKPLRYMCIIFWLFIIIIIIWIIQSQNVTSSCLILSLQTGSKEDIEKFSKRTVKVGSLLFSFWVTLMFDYVF